MQFLKVGLIAALGMIVGLSALGTQVSQNRAIDFSPVSDAKAALRMKLVSPTVREVHFFDAKGLVCGQVRHDESTAGFTPFAYNHSFGLSVAEVWGKGEPEAINRQYGCHFLPMAYSNEWKAPFWGETTGDIYHPEEQALSEHQPAK